MRKTGCRPWHEIALELCLQATPKKISALCEELNEALKGQHFGELHSRAVSTPMGLTNREKRKSRLSPINTNESDRKRPEDLMLAREMHFLCNRLLDNASHQKHKKYD